MDHAGAHVMAIALLAALYHQRRTGEGQWVDLACIEAGIAMTGPAVLDATVNGRTLRDDGAVALQPQLVAGDGAARHLPVPRRRLVGRHRLPPRRRLGDASSTSSGRRGPRTPRYATLRRPARRPGHHRRRTGRVDVGARARRRRRRGPRRRRARRPGQAAARALRRRRRQRRLGPVADGRPRQARRRARRRPAGAPVGAPTGASSGPARCSAQDNERVYAEVLGLTTAEIGRLAADGVI